MPPEIPQFAFPLRQESGRIVEVEQDTIADVRQCVALLLRTPRAARPLAPHIGLVDPTFSSDVDAARLAGDLEEWEPRADVTVEVTPAAGDRHVTVRVALAGSTDQTNPVA